MCRRARGDTRSTHGLGKAPGGPAALRPEDRQPQGEDKAALAKPVLLSEPIAFPPKEHDMLSPSPLDAS